MNDDFRPSFTFDRRRWLKATGTLLVGGLLANRILGEPTAVSAGSLETKSPTPAPGDKDDRRYIYGFECYSGF